MKRTFSLLITLLVLLQASAQEKNDILQHTASWQAMLQKAQKENKLIFVDCYFTGCHPCAQMDEEVFPNSTVSRELQESFVGVKINVFDEKLGDTIMMKYGIAGYPTFMILDPSGKLISMFGGYQDPSLLMKQLTDAKQKQKRKEFISGFSTAASMIYPVFYQKYFDRKDRQVDTVAANKWIMEQKNRLEEPVAMAILKTNKLNTEIEAGLLDNYRKFKSMYGEELVITKVSAILTSQLNMIIGKQKNEEQFQQFLSSKSKLFPASDWKIFRFILGYHYYGTVAKDKVALLEFMIGDPVVYKNYFGALYNGLYVQKQLNETTLKLLCKWTDKAITEDAPLELISTAAYIHEKNKDMEGYRRFANMALSKAKKFNMPVERYEKMLAVKE